MPCTVKPHDTPYPRGDYRNAAIYAQRRSDLFDRVMDCRKTMVACRDNLGKNVDPSVVAMLYALSELINSVADMELDGLMAVPAEEAAQPA